MPSASTGRHAAPGRIDLRRHAASIAAVALPALLLLSACNTGSVGEARRGQEQDADLTPIMASQQATRIADRYFPGTPTPAAEQPLYPFVGQLAVSPVINPDGSPQGAFASVPVDAGTLYVSARLHDTSPGQIITAIWTDQYGNVQGEQAVNLEGAGDPRWVALPLGLSPAMSPGPYAVWLYSDEWRIGSLTFQLTGPGSAPQVYSELPANPQAPAATEAPRRSERSEGDQQDGQNGQNGDSQDQQDGNWQPQQEGEWQPDQSGQWQGGQEGGWEGEQSGGWQDPQPWEWPEGDGQ